MHYFHNHVYLEFSLVSGGHSSAIMASNYEGGMTLDLSLLSYVSLSPDKSLVDVASAATWHEVYQLLDANGLTVAGARAGGVGVAGFLLGGGISVLAARHGWSCDTITEVEIVMFDGTVLNINEHQHPDLFRAVKGGGSNFGIPTQFTLRTFPSDRFQLAFVRYEWEAMEQLMTHLVAGLEEDSDLNSSFDLSVAYDTSSGKISSVLMFTTFGELENSAVWKEILGVPHSGLSVSNATLGQLASLVDESNPAGFR